MKKLLFAFTITTLTYQQTHTAQQKTQQNVKSMTKQLHEAAEVGMNPIPFLEQGADINGLIAEGGDTALIKAIVSNRKGITNDEYLADYIGFFIDEKANVDMPNRLKNTALCLAAFDGLTKTVKVLIEAKANVDIQTEQDRTAAMCAVINNKFDTFQILLNASNPRAVVILKNDTNKTLIELAHEKDKEKGYNDYTNLINQYFVNHRNEQLRLITEYKAKKLAAKEQEELFQRNKKLVAHMNTSTTCDATANTANSPQSITDSSDDCKNIETTNSTWDKHDVQLTPINNNYDYIPLKNESSKQVKKSWFGKKTVVNKI